MGTETVANTRAVAPKSAIAADFAIVVFMERRSPPGDRVAAHPPAWCFGLHGGGLVSVSTERLQNYPTKVPHKSNQARGVGAALHGGRPAVWYASIALPAPGDATLATRAATLLATSGMEANIDTARGLDHGVFIPMKVAFPDADIPTVEMSLDASLDPALHLAAGRALAPLRDEGVLIIGSGMSFHNMRAYGDPRATPLSREFDNWLTAAVAAEAPERAALLEQWADAPGGRFSHPREEHLLPLMVAAGASGAAGVQEFGELTLQTAISGYRFD